MPQITFLLMDSLSAWAKPLNSVSRNSLDSVNVLIFSFSRTYQVVRNILTNERYIGDALLQKTYTTDCISKTVKKNQGDRLVLIHAG